MRQFGDIQVHSMNITSYEQFGYGRNRFTDSLASALDMAWVRMIFLVTVLAWRTLIRSRLSPRRPRWRRLTIMTTLNGLVTNNTEQAKILENGLSELGCRVIPTSANFVYCDVGNDAAEFARRLREKGVRVRPLGAWGSASCIRVSIGRPEQNRVFLDSIQQFGSHVQR
jgi:hypothetical protein